MFYKIFFLLFISTNVIANVYIGSEFSYSQYNSNVTEQYKLNSKGTGYSLILGKTIQFIGLEAFYKLKDTTAPITHESTSYDRIEKSYTYGLALRVNLQYTYFKVGYALNHQVGQIQDSSGSTVNDERMNAIYKTSTNDNGTTSGLSYGLGIQYRWSKALRFTLGYEAYKTGRVNENYQQINIGIIFKLPDLSPDLTE